MSALVAALSVLLVSAPRGVWAQAGTVQYRSILASAYADDRPGAVALVARGDQIVYLDAVGFADQELGVRLAPDMVFEIGSITKQFTAAAILILAEEGRLSLSDPITRHLPDYPSYGDSITIVHLLTHTSGIVSYTESLEYAATGIASALSVDELIDLFSGLPTEFAPGDRWAYSNSGYVLLGAIIEAASGLPYETFVERRIFEPLGMERSYYGVNSRIIPGRVSGYGAEGGGYVKQPSEGFAQPYADGALMMTVEDWYRWSRALFGGEIVSAESLERMTTPVVLNDGSPTTYAYGLSIADVRGYRAIRHGGARFGFVTNGLYVPEQNVYVAVFSNNRANDVGPDLVATKLAALAIGEPFPQFTEVALAEDVLRRYVGVYRIDDDAECVVTVRDGALYTQWPGDQPMRASPASETHFFYRTSLSHLAFVIEGGEVTGLLIYQRGSPDAERAVKASGDVPTREVVVLDRAILERYVGHYELQPGFDLTVSLDGDRLMGRAPGLQAVQLHPASDTEFSIEEIEAQITFVVGPDGRASELILFRSGREMRARRKD